MTRDIPGIAMIVRLLLLRLIALAALAVSAALLASYLVPEAAFCSFESGCEKVKQSAGAALGIALPILGVVGFGALLATSLFAGARSGRLLWLLAVSGGLIGLVLLLVQLLVIRHTCPYCAIVDGSALAVAVAAAVGDRGQELPASGVRARVGWALGSGLALLAGAAWALTADNSSKQSPLPPEVMACWVPGKITVVEVANFGCRHCKEMDHNLTQLLEEDGKDVRLVRFMVSPPESAGPRSAGEAYLCAEKQGKGKEMAEELFGTTDLSQERCIELAKSLGLNVSQFEACIADPATANQMDAVLDWSKKANPRGYPIVWIQDRMFFGTQSMDTLRAALEEARQKLEAEARPAVGQKSHDTRPPDQSP